ncbi:hypothetical protein LIER_16102 [Lithospermum erythrorhizon]|uniref:Reverse transcriptase domain-containing protein n=1 Tax=Lithospermum erythrorhizon TaxID=34254 RepID=A0AAV3QA04_LITER
MPGVDPSVSVHRVYVDPYYKPVKQKKRTFSEEKREAIRQRRERPFARRKVISSGLKNAGATHQRMVNNVFSNQIGRNMEIYVDDMLIKSREASDHEANIRESFENLLRYNLRLNLDKCVFGVTSGKFLGYMISQRGIEPNPDKTSVLQSPQLLEWPMAGDVLHLYLAVSELVLSSILIREEEKMQRPVYYVNRVRRGAETGYPLAEKLVFSLIVAARKLKPYFEAHPVEGSTPVEWVSKEAFRMREVMNNAPEGEGSMPRPWYQDILEFLSSGALQKDPSGPLRKCITREEGLAVVEEMHGGICGSHINSKAIIQRTLRSGIFCPSVAKDAQHHFRRCDACQRHAIVPHQPPHEMINMLYPIPFY